MIYGLKEQALKTKTLSHNKHTQDNFIPFYTHLWSLLKRIPWYWKAFLLLSVVMISISIIFSECFYLSHPQFPFVENFDSHFKLIKKYKIHSYNSFFVIDFIWAGFLIYGLIKTLKSQQTFTKVTGLFAYGFDGWENLLYLDVFSSAAENSSSFYNITFTDVVIFKEVSYLIFLFSAFGFWYIQKSKDSNKPLIFNWEEWKQVLLSSWLSLLVIGFIIFALSMVAQGGTLIVDLFYNPISLIYCAFIINHLAVICAHYPIYFTLKKKEFFHLKMERKWRLWGTGNIAYIPQNVEEKTDGNYISKKKILNFRTTIYRSIGILFYAAWIYVLVSIFYRFHQSSSGIAMPISGGLALLLIYYMTRIIERKENIKKHIENHYYKENQDNTSYESTFPRSIQSVHLFPKTLALGAILLISSVIAAFFYGWSVVTFWLFISSTLFFMIAYTQFRAYRSILGMLYGIDDYYDFDPFSGAGNAKKTIKKLHEEISADYKEKVHTLRWIGNMSNNVYFIKVMRIGGYTVLFTSVLLFFLRITNINPEWWNSINPINVALIYLVMIYSGIALGLKHYFFYNQKSNPYQSDQKIREPSLPERVNYVVPGDPEFNSSKAYFTTYFPMLLLLIGILAYYSAAKGNKLHNLKPIKENPSSVLSLEVYLKNFQERNQRSVGENNHYYTVNAEGGGLKSNIWTMYVLDSLNRIGVLDRTLSMSGVSGGSVGIANFISVSTNYPIDSHKLMINQIGCMNLVSSEIHDFITWDMLREHVPFQGELGEDRTDYTMARYEAITKMEEFGYDTLSCRNFWYKAYQKSGERLPAVLFNSTEVGNGYGYASSIGKDLKLPGGKSVLDLLDNKSISFYDAVSTSNRFPILSPTAQISGLGHFIDGGYFENTGMLTTDAFLDTLLSNPNCDSTIFKNEISNIIISNSKTEYIKEVLREWLAGESKNGDSSTSTSQIPIYENPTKENSAIINTIVSLDKLPHYWHEKEKSNIHICLPHHISYHDVIEYLGGEPQYKNPKISLSVENLKNLIKEKNCELKSTLEEHGYDTDKWGIVEPPLSRLLSEPAVEYMGIMTKLAIKWEL